MPEAAQREVQAVWALRASPLFDREWYIEQHPELRAKSKDPVVHYVRSGVGKGFDPHPWFDTDWYLLQYADVQAAGVNPLLHYINFGAVELRMPHPLFDAEFYVDQHPDAAPNPLLHYLSRGQHEGWPTRAVGNIDDYLPVREEIRLPLPPGTKVDVIVPVYRGLPETRACLESIVNDPDRTFHRLIVIDDCSPEPELSAWLLRFARRHSIDLLRNERNLGFVRTVNRGMSEASPDADVLLLNSDTRVPRRWLQRLVGQAHKAERVGTVTPFSNNATICSYPSPRGGPLPSGFDLAAVDDACREANAGRSVDIPTAVGFCMYIRRDCLDDVGLFDAETFGRGYGEENDFCLRASARSWRHLLACDTFVFHAGEVSFGPNSPERVRAWDLLVGRHPQYPGLVERFGRRDSAGPFRFAATVALFGAASRPKVLLVTHRLGGGTERHVREVARLGNALFLKLVPRGQDVELAVPSQPGHPALILPAEQLADLVRVLERFGLSRIHVHHLLGNSMDVRKLIHELELSFDFTVHDYYTVCPQVTFLPDGHKYCGEPDVAGCNACITRRPSFGVLDILSWRKQHEWLFREADRVICPSEDVRCRLAKYGLAEHAIVVPHEPVLEEVWPVLRRPPIRNSEPLRVAILGLLAPYKGAATFAACVAAGAGRWMAFIVIGKSEPPLQGQLGQLVTETGPYHDPDLAGLIETVDPHVIWFPAPWPETWSYTLSAAVASGRPIVATRIGAFPERLRGRPWTWLVDQGASVATWLNVFGEVRSALGAGRWDGPAAPREVAASNWYAGPYLEPKLGPRVQRGVADLRRPGRISALVIPERFAGRWSPCAYIRLLQPLTHPAVAEEVHTVVVDDAREARRYRADLLVTQRTAVAGLEEAEDLVERARRHGTRILYDLDDNLVDIGPSHSEWEKLRAYRPAILALARAADAVSVSSEPLRRALLRFRPEARVVPNSLDERIWAELRPVPPPRAAGPVRVLYMGTATHAGDLALIEGACRDVRAEFGRAVSFEILGVTGSDDFRDWAERVAVPESASRSYPGFVDWFKSQDRWHVGVAPLVDDEFNRAKSAIKALDYAALGLAVVASDVPAYRSTVKPRETGLLVANQPEAWREALRRLVADPGFRHRLATGARAALLEEHLLRERAKLWLDLLRSLHAPERRARVPSRGSEAEAC